MLCKKLYIFLSIFFNLALFSSFSTVLAKIPFCWRNDQTYLTLIGGFFSNLYFVNLPFKSDNPLFRGFSCCGT